MKAVIFVYQAVLALVGVACLIRNKKCKTGTLAHSCGHYLKLCTDAMELKNGHYH